MALEVTSSGGNTQPIPERGLVQVSVGQSGNMVITTKDGKSALVSGLAPGQVNIETVGDEIKVSDIAGKELARIKITVDGKLTTSSGNVFLPKPLYPPALPQMGNDFWDKPNNLAALLLIMAEVMTMIMQAKDADRQAKQSLATAMFENTKDQAQAELNAAKTEMAGYIASGIVNSFQAFMAFKTVDKLAGAEATATASLREGAPNSFTNLENDISDKKAELVNQQIPDGKNPDGTTHYRPSWMQQQVMGLPPPEVGGAPQQGAAAAPRDEAAVRASDEFKAKADEVKNLEAKRTSQINERSYAIQKQIEEKAKMWERGASAGESAAKATTTMLKGQFDAVKTIYGGVGQMLSTQQQSVIGDFKSFDELVNGLMQFIKNLQESKTQQVHMQG